MKLYNAYSHLYMVKHITCSIDIDVLKLGLSQVQEETEM